MNILVTGATGFIGANLVKALVKNEKDNIFITARSSSNLWRIEDVKDKLQGIANIDLENKTLITDMLKSFSPDYIYHVATYGGFPGQTDKEKIVSTNFIGTMNLLDSAVKYGVKQFINTGSSSEYGIKDKPMKEDEICTPVNFYGLTKLAATNYCTMVGKNLDYKVCTLRLFSPYGALEDKSRLYPSIISALKAGKPPELSKPDSVRDFIPVEKVVKVYLTIVNLAYKPGDIINVGSGKQETIKHLYTSIAQSMNTNIEPVWGKAAQRKFEPVRWEADITKLKSLMDWSD